jgi:hypothetical protein
MKSNLSKSGVGERQNKRILIPLVELLARVAYRRLRNVADSETLPEYEKSRESSTVRPLFDGQAKR